jgi:predicted RNase H-like nuclease
MSVASPRKLCPRLRTDECRATYPWLSTACSLADMSGERFVGLDLGWTTGATGVAVADETGRLVASGRVRTDDEIEAWVTCLGGPIAVAAVDAPLVVPNETGMRDCERLIGHAYGAFGASAHTSNRTRLGGAPRAFRLAQRLGWSPDPTTPAGADAVCLEVYPHPAMIGLFELPYRLDYKKGSTHRRLPGFRALVGLLEEIPELDVRSSSRWADVHRVLIDPKPGDLNRWEDELDAILCAHLAWLWRHRPGALIVYGSLEDGYIAARVMRGAWP